MTTSFKQFIATSIYDNVLQSNLSSFHSNVFKRIINSCEIFENLELAKKRASYIKWKITENLDKHLIDFEANIIKKGGKVIWATNAAEANNEVLSILKRYDSNKLFNGKSLISDEIGLNDFLKNEKVEVVNSAIDDFLLNSLNTQRNDAVYTTAFLNFTEVRQKLNSTIKASLEADKQELLEDIVSYIFSEIKNIKVAVSAANFAISESGQIVILNNEGGSYFADAFARCHIILTPIDCLINSINDIDLFLSLYATHSEGQAISSYNQIIGPKHYEDNDGPEEFVVILIDNGRSDLMQFINQRQALHCINCGACNHACPVYTKLPHQSYPYPIGGPISVVKNIINDNKDDFNYASTSCGNCNNICPVNIDVQNLIIHNRKESNTSSAEKLSWYTWKKFVLNRKNMNGKSSIKNFTIKQFFKSSWGNNKELPSAEPKTFNQLYREQNNIK
ncbi:MAG: LUD domain-containing protein [Bacteroidia bacterium]